MAVPRPQRNPLAPPPHPLSRAARTVFDPGTTKLDEWYLPNPDPRVNDPRRLIFDKTTGLWLVRGRARPKQRPPEGRWFVWVVLSGRGFGKSRTGAEWLNLRASTKRKGEQMMVAGRTPSDVRDYLLYGPGGLLTHHPEIEYQPANRLLIWPNGVQGLIRSGANPEEFRGFSGDTALLDEFAAWDYPGPAWDTLIFGLREGTDPRICITTTPRPIKPLRDILASPGVVVVRGSSRENEANLAESYVEYVIAPREGTRLGRQEIEGEIVEDVEGALWKLSLIEEQRAMRDAVPPLVRLVVGVDPQGIKAPGSETGIVVVGSSADGQVWVVEDASINGTPAEWGSRAVAAYERNEADVIVGEKNFGGDMVESTVRTVSKKAGFKMVSASRGKIQRAEPIAALYEQGKVHHVGAFPALEDEMCTFTGAKGERSPNRMDALVWAITELQEEPARVLTRATWGR